MKIINHKQKKAQSLSINTIIIVILAILVLVILIFVLGRNVKNLNDTTDSCKSKGGNCKESCDFGSEIEINAKDCNENEKCCMALLTQKEKS